MFRPVLIGMVFAAAVFGQFEVAAVKPSEPARVCSMERLPGGRFRASHCTVMNLVNYAFEIPEQQVTDAPPWMTSDRFDIAALPVAGAGIDSHENALRVQELLRERFGLKFHHQQMERPIFALTLAKGGPKVTPNAGAEYKIVRQGRKQIVFQKVTMAKVAWALSGPYHSAEMSRPVVDRTGLAGEFDFTLNWAPGVDRTGQAMSVFTAIQEVGLRLAADKGPVDTLVVDAVSRPSEN